MEIIGIEKTIILHSKVVKEKDSLE